MLGFIPTTETDLSGFDAAPAGSTTHAHPSPALAEVQALAVDHGRAALVVVSVDPDEWAACCPDCLRVVGYVHDCAGREGRGVMPHEAVLRPDREAIRPTERTRRVL